MSNIIPPLLSNTPPPPPSLDDEEDDEFGDFIGTNNLSYGCENLSLPTSPVHSPEKVSISKEVDVEFSEVIHAEEFNFEHNFKTTIKLEEPHLNEFPSSPNNNEDKSEETNDSIEETFQENISESIPDYNSQDEDEKSGHEDIEDVFSNIENPNLVLEKPLNGDSQLSDHIELFCDDVKVQKNNLKEHQTIEIHNKITDFINYEKEDSIVSKPVCEDTLSKFTSTETENQFNKSEPLETLEESSIDEDDFQQFCSEVSCDNPIYSSDSVINPDFTRTDNLPDTTLVNNFFIENDDITAEVVDIDFTRQDELASSTSKDINYQEIDDDNFDDFADFSSYQQSGPVEVSSNIPASETDLKVLPSTSNIDDDDDFGDFASSSFDTKFPELYQSESVEETSSTTEENFLQLVTETQALEKAKELFDELFPIPDVNYEDYNSEENERNSKIFELLKDVTDTPALSYQWPKSASQKLLLRALNIDERNILPPWNSSMPIFAYNLGLQPLEPTKTENQSSLPQLSPSSSTKVPPEDIPSAQFDWKGSGLENPLDGGVSEPTKEVPDLELPKKPESPIAQLAAPPESVPAIIPQTTSHLDDYGEFSSHCSDPPPPHNTWVNLTPLRETYISNNVAESSSSVDKKSNFDEEVWLSSNSYNSWSLTNKKSNENKIVSSVEKNVLEPETKESDDDFDDFQAASFEPPSHPSTVLPSSSIIAEPKQSLPQLVEAKKIPVEDDEFTDFQFSTPVVEETHFGSSNSILKPVPVYQNVLPSISTQINWPDPGITDEEITKLEEVFCKPNQPKKENLDLKETKGISVDSVHSKKEFGNSKDFHKELVMSLETKKIKSSEEKIKEMKPKKVNQVRKKEPDFGEFQTFSKTIQTTKIRPTKNIKQSSLDDEEWSDFVSAQKLSPVHKLAAVETERTSSPDLPLSVFNLGSIQPAKQPIPVITPQGLVQTKLSANMSDMSPKTQVKINKPIFQPTVSMPPPSIISSQYATQAYNFNSKSTASKSSVVQDDDEWGEFVSSPLPPQQPINGYQNSGWTNFAPNIITNPGHCVQNVPHIAATSKKNLIPNLVLPELDFVAPKNRTYTTRKK